MNVSPRLRAKRKLRSFRIVIFAIVAVYFLVPLFSMLEFSTRGLRGGGRNFEAWKAIGEDEQLRSAIFTSLELAAFTVVIMLVLLVPTMVWVRLRVPGMTRTIEFLCLLPLTIPALVIVVGLKPVYAWVTYFFGNSALTLTFAYAILVLPYAYRSIDAGLASLDLKTISEAARSLGASWFTVMTRVVAPNITSALVSAAFISVALVLGEFTLASLLNFNNLQVVINLFGKSNGQVSVAASLASLIFAFIVLALLSFAGRSQRRPAKVVPAPTPPPAPAKEG